MDVESEVWDEIADRLVVIYNQMRLTRSDIEQFERGIAKAKVALAHLEAKASQYEAMFSSPEVEGTPA